MFCLIVFICRMYFCFFLVLFFASLAFGLLCSVLTRCDPLYTNKKFMTKCHKIRCKKSTRLENVFSVCCCSFSSSSLCTPCSRLMLLPLRQFLILFACVFVFAFAFSYGLSAVASRCVVGSVDSLRSTSAHFRRSARPSLALSLSHSWHLACSRAQVHLAVTHTETHTHTHSHQQLPAFGYVCITICIR